MGTLLSNVNGHIELLIATIPRGMTKRSSL
jgi:hypothetical protein